MKKMWVHEASVPWLQARSRCLTASDIVNLLADYKRVVAGKIDVREAQQFAKLFGEKMNEEVDPTSYGPAARGHYMEPYALEEFCELTGEKLKWWDDRILINGSLGFSPDALDISQIPGVEGHVHGDDIYHTAGTSTAPTKMAEIKCYEAGKHFQRLNALINESDLDERWQVACGMCVCPSIIEGILVFYAPQCRSLFTKRYLRTDLLEEIEVIKSITHMWNEFTAVMYGSRISQSKTKYRESNIYDRYMLDSMLD